MTAARRRAGQAIAAAAGELTRLWRATRAQARRGLWSGLIDGIAEDFFARLGASLADGRDPALVWPEVTGLVRLDPRDLDRSRDELDAEWDAVQTVLSAACDALACDADLREWIARALVLARAGARTLDQGGGPAGVAVVWSLAGLGVVTRGHDTAR